MENSEILGFQFEPTKALQPDSGLSESYEIFSSADSELNIFRRNEASVDHFVPLCVSTAVKYKQRRSACVNMN